jgi:hypothetical protein
VGLRSPTAMQHGRPVTPDGRAIVASRVPVGSPPNRRRDAAWRGSAAHVPGVARRRLPWSRQVTTGTDYSLHQMAPYIGRMKTSMARALIKRRTRAGDLVIDPFCGSGVVALEAVALNRRVLVGDWNPYATLLTRAKLFAPRSVHAAERRLRDTWQLAESLVDQQDLRTVPRWVRAFFHPETLRVALAFRDACVERGDEFLLAILLGVLHHQRPGFLSYPSSHLVPYLRERSFPRQKYPDLYKRRDVRSRLEAKIKRSFRRTLPSRLPSRRAILVDARRFPRVRRISAVITSPPYMNELDYVRDNRLRLWFIDRALPANLNPTDGKDADSFRVLLRSVCERVAPGVVPGGYFILVLGDSNRGLRRRVRTADLTREVFAGTAALHEFRLTAVYEDTIPDIRRSRRECRGTKRETILVYRKRGV